MDEETRDAAASPYREAWRTYRIVAGDAPDKHAEEFYAPDLDTAFGLARVRWPCPVPATYRCL